MSSLKVVFAGTPEFAAEILGIIIQAKYEVVLVMTQPDRPGGRGLKLQQSPVKQTALYHQIPVLQPHSLKLDSKYSEEAFYAKQVLETSTFDVMVVAAYGLILPKWLLDLGARASPLGCINIHASLLPRWRGAAPIQRAILAGDQQTGTCIMRMAEGLDTGPIILQEALTISAQDTAGLLHGKLALQGGKLLNEVLNGLFCGQVFKLQEQANAGVIYAQKILKEDESLYKWFKRSGPKGKETGWVDCNAPDGKGGYKSCGRKKGAKRAKYPACRPTPAGCKKKGKGKTWGKTK